MGFNVGGLTKLNVILVDWMPEAPPSEEKVAADLFSQAKKYFRMEMYEKAIKKCEEILENYKSSSVAPSAQLMIGDSRVRLGEHEAATPAFDKVMSDFSGCKETPGAYSGKGDANFEQKNWDAAVKEYRQVVVDKYKGKQCVYSNVIWYDHAQARLIEIKKLREAEKLAGKQAHENEAKTLFEEGEKLFHAKKYRQARPKYQKIVKDYTDTTYFPKAKERIKEIDAILAKLAYDATAKKLFEAGEKLYLEEKRLQDALIQYRAVVKNYSKAAPWAAKSQARIDEINAILTQRAYDVAARKLYFAAEKLFHQKKLREALVKYQAVINKYPKATLYIKGNERQGIVGAEKRIAQIKAELAIKYNFTFKDLKIEANPTEFKPGHYGNEESVQLALTVAEKVRPALASWKVEIKDQYGFKVREFSGSGAPSEQITWDGRDDEGKYADDGLKYKATLTVVSKKDAKKTASVISEEIYIPLLVRPDENGVITLKLRIEFKYNRAEILKSQVALLKEAVKILNQKDLKERKVKVEGHTDSTGPAAGNKKLSMRRAQSVFAWLKKHGVNAERMEAKGFGEDKPRASNKIKTGQARNRRVEIKIMPAGSE